MECRSHSPIRFSIPFGADNQPTGQALTAITGELNGMKVQDTSSPAISSSTFASQPASGTGQPSTVSLAGRSSIVPVSESSTRTCPSQLDRFLDGGPFPELSKKEKDEIRKERLAFSSMVRKNESKFGEYHLAGFPYLPISTKHTTYLVPTDDIKTYLVIAGHYKDLRFAIDFEDKERAIEARDKLMVSLNDPHCLKMSVAEAARFQAESAANFIAPEVVEKILDSKLDYFIEALADENKRPNVIFTLLTLQDKLNDAKKEVDECIEYPSVWDDEDDSLRLSIQVGNSRLIIQNESAQKAKQALCHMQDMISHLLQQDYDQAKNSQQSIKLKQENFHVE